MEVATSRRASLGPELKKITSESGTKLGLPQIQDGRGKFVVARQRRRNESIELGISKTLPPRCRIRQRTRIRVTHMRPASRNINGWPLITAARAACQGSTSRDEHANGAISPCRQRYSKDYRSGSSGKCTAKGKHASHAVPGKADLSRKTRDHATDLIASHDFDITPTSTMKTESIGTTRKVESRFKSISAVTSLAESMDH